MLIVGSRYYGKTDELKGLCYVGTQFLHINYLPLIPTSSYCIWNFDGVMIESSIPISGKSVLIGYLRTWLNLIGAFLTLCCLAFREVPSVCWGLGILSASCYFTVILTYVVKKPSPARALFLASCIKSIQMPPERLAEYYLDDPRIEELLKTAEGK